MLEMDSRWKMSNLTQDGRRKGQKVLRERLAGWPKVTTTWDKAMKEGFRRFDEPGMVLKFKSNMPAPKNPWRYQNDY